MIFSIISSQGVLQAADDGTPLANFGLGCVQPLYSPADLQKIEGIQVEILHTGACRSICLDLQASDLMGQICSKIPTCRILQPRLRGHMDAYLIDQANAARSSGVPTLYFRKHGLYRLWTGCWAYVCGDTVLGLPQGYVPAGQLMEGMGYPHFASLVADRALDCNQSGWTFMPVVSVNYKLPRWNFAARYEFKGRMHLKNQSNNTSGVAEFDDGQKVWAEIPALLTLGVSYDVLPNLRASVGYHYFFDRQAAQYEHREKKLKSGTQEFLAGLEYDINKRITVSAGYQSTNYGLGSNSEFLSDMSFVTSSNSVGLGAAFQLTPTISMNVAYFKTFYKTYTKHHDDFNHIKSTLSGSMQALVGSGQLTANELQAAATLGAMLPQLNTEGTDRFHRTNDVFGVNLNFDF